MRLGQLVLVPVARPSSAVELARQAAAIARADDGTVLFVTVLDLEADTDQVTTARSVLRDAVDGARASGAAAEGTMVRDRSVSAGILQAIQQRGATMVLMGWRGRTSQANVFSELIDAITGRSPVPLGVLRLQDTPIERVLLPVRDDHLVPAGARGVRLAAALADRLRPRTHGDVVVVQCGANLDELPGELAGSVAQVVDDCDRLDQAIAKVARPSDLIVAPVAPTAHGLRAASTHMVWGAPDSWLLVAVDVGPVPQHRQREIAAAARTGAGAHDILLSVDLPHGRQEQLDTLSKVLHTCGVVGQLESWLDHRRRTAHARAMVQVEAATTAVAITALIATIRDTAELDEAQISCDIANVL